MRIAYGSDKIELKLPPGVPWEILSCHAAAPPEDPHSCIMEALRNPIGSPPLRELVHPGETVCLLANDFTRVARTELILPPVIAELEQAGIKKEDIFIVFANGAHRMMTDDEMVNLAGRNMALEHDMYNHDCNNAAELVYLGQTSRGTPVSINRKVARADRRILTGSVVYHFFAGFGGGRKALIPGVAGWDTIQKNHSLMLDDRACSGRLAGNPVHEDLVEGALLAGCDFLVNTVLNEREELLGVYAGDMVQAHGQACALAKQVYGVPLKRLADVVIAGCGGAPKDINLYQAHKTLDNAMAALKRGGQVILLAQCSEGFGSFTFEEWAVRYSSLDEMEAALHEQFILGGHKAYSIARLLQRGRVYLVSQLSPEQSRLLGFIPAKTLNEALEAVYEKDGNLFTYVLPQGSLCVPRYEG